MNLTRRAILALTALVCAGCGTINEGATRSDLDATIAGHVRSGFSGVVLVARSDDVILHGAYGALAGRAVERSDKFWIASTGKQFVSAAILVLADGGKLALEDPLSKFFPDAPADKAGVTVRQLLSHTSGFAQSYVAEQFSTRETATPAMLAEPLAGPPGEQFRYSNINYQLAAAIVEIASGENYRSFVKERLWRPARLTGAGFSTPETAKDVSPIATPLPERLKRATWDEQGVYSTAMDLFRWRRALGKGDMLTPQSLTTLFEPVAPITEGEAALGWFVDRSPRGQKRVFTRGNEDFGANSLIYLYPETDVTIIVLTHAGEANDDLSWSRFIHRELEAALEL